MTPGIQKVFSRKTCPPLIECLPCRSPLHGPRRTPGRKGAGVSDPAGKETPVRFFSLPPGLLNRDSEMGSSSSNNLLIESHFFCSTTKFLPLKLNVVNSLGSEAQEQRTPSPREEIQKGFSVFKGAVMKSFPSPEQAILSGFTAWGTRCYCLDLLA